MQIKRECKSEDAGNRVCVRFVFCLLSFFVLSSCTSLPAVDVYGIRQSMNNVNLGDGIDKEEAIIIAKNYMLDNGLDYDWNVGKIKSVDESEDKMSWSITFSPLEDGWGSGRRKSSEISFQHLMPYFVMINKNNGNINIITIDIK